MTRYIRRRPRCLDLFCGAGGASNGYHDAGFNVTGVDLAPQPNYPYKFIQTDAMTFDLTDFDFIHASPPCQAYSLAAAGGKRRGKNHPELIDSIRERLIAADVPYVIENVPQAPLLDPITLCGTSFNLPIIRHRAFECSFPIEDVPSCGYKPTARNRHKGYLAYPYGRKSWEPNWDNFVIPVVWPWMTGHRVKESGQAIPPAYTAFIGRALLVILEAAEAENGGSNGRRAGHTPSGRGD